MWGLLADSGGGGGDHAASLLAAVQRALKIRLLKHVSSSGMLSANGASARRRSSAANSEGSLLFHHLRVLDCMREAMLAERAAEVHRACVEALEGLVEDNAMAQHCEGAGAFLRAAQLHRKDARRLSAQRETTAAVPATRHALRCLDRCDGDGDAHARDTLEIDCVGFMISPAGGLVELAGVESILGRVQRLEQTEAWRETPEYVRLTLKAMLQLTRVFLSLEFDSHTAHNSVGRMSEELRSTFFGMAASALATASPTLESTTGQELDVRHLRGPVRTRCCGVLCPTSSRLNPIQRCTWCAPHARTRQQHMNGAVSLGSNLPRRIAWSNLPRRIAWSNLPRRIAWQVPQCSVLADFAFWTSFEVSAATKRAEKWEMFGESFSYIRNVMLHWEANEAQFKTVVASGKFFFVNSQPCPAGLRFMIGGAACSS